MLKSFNPNIPNLIMMIRPKSFGFNRQTAESNYFQQSELSEDVISVAQKEFDEMVRLLQKHNIEVVQFDDIADNLPDSVFSNNWISHFPSGEIIVYPMLTRNRRDEVRQDIIDWMEINMGGKTVIDLTKHAEEGKFLEGTGSIVFDYINKIAYACSSPRTDFEIFNDLCARLNYTPVKFRSEDDCGREIYHTNVMMTIAEKFSIICLASVTKKVEKETIIKSLNESSKEIIEITQEQLNSFAGNAFEVINEQNESCLLISQTAFDSLTSLQIDRIQKYSKILPISIPTIEKIGGGSVRCMSTGLFYSAR
jgi:hypothetical protein